MRLSFLSLCSARSHPKLNVKFMFCEESDHLNK
jgi:hypothetical protein